MKLTSAPEEERDYGYPVPWRGDGKVIFDFDGVLAEDTWPSPTVGAAIPEGIKMLLHYAQEGHAIMIYTSRPSSHKRALWNWVKEQELQEYVYDIITDKPIGGIYIDDRAHRFER